MLIFLKIIFIPKNCNIFLTNFFKKIFKNIFFFIIFHRSTEDVSPPNFSERNSGYYERNSRLVSDNDTYLRRSNHNSYQSSSSSSNTNINSNNNSSGSSSNNNNNSSSSNNPDNRSRTRDRLYRNGPNTAAGVSSTTGSSSSAATVLSDR